MLEIALIIATALLSGRFWKFQTETGIYSIKEWIKAEIDKLQ